MRTACCCCKPRTCSLVIGVLSLLGALIALIYAVFIFVSGVIQSGNDPMSYILISGILLAIVAALLIPTSILLLVGICKVVPCMMVPYLVSVIILAVLHLAYVIYVVVILVPACQVETAFCIKIGTLVGSTIIHFILDAYFWCVVHAHYKQIQTVQPDEDEIPGHRMFK